MRLHDRYCLHELNGVCICAPLAMARRDERLHHADQEPTYAAVD